MTAQEKNYDTFMGALNTIRGVKGWTNGEISNAIGVTRPHLSSVISGKKPLTDLMLAKLVALAEEAEDRKHKNKVLIALEEVFPPTIINVLQEAVSLSGAGDDYSGFLIDCIYRRRDELLREEARRMRESKDPLDNDEWGGTDEAKEEIRKDKNAKAHHDSSLPKWITERKFKDHSNKGQSDNQS